MFVFYGAQSPGNSFLHPREMDPSGAYNGKLVSSLMSLSGTQEGGALMFIDAANYLREQHAGAARASPANGGQRQMTAAGAEPMAAACRCIGRITIAVPAVGRHQPRADRRTVRAR